MKNNYKQALTLFLTFFKIGLFTFGGGYAMIPLIEEECVHKKKWIEHEELMNMTVIAESTPGPIAINSATYVGYKFCGVLGSAMATLGVVTPSFTIIFLISLFFNDFLDIPVVANAFKGIKVAVAILITNAGIRMIVKMKKQVLPFIVMILSFILMMLITIFAWNFSTIYLILITGFIGFLTQVIFIKKNGGDAQ